MAKRIAYLGPAGTFTEEAVILFDPQAERVAASTIRAAADTVDAGRADASLVPIENSNEGSVPDTLDLLIHVSHLLISREVVLPIDQYLMAKPGIAIEDIRMVYSHSNALGQCRGFLEKRLPKATVVATLSTVAAVVAMQESQSPAAAIAPKRAAELYKASVIAEKVQDSEGNVTRFVLLSKEDHEPTGKDRTSCAFSFSQDKPGQLYSTLGDFASRNINLSKLESRPAKSNLGRYIFLVDLDGHRLDADISEALDSVQKRTSMFKIFGSYPLYQG